MERRQLPATGGAQAAAAKLTELEAAPEKVRCRSSGGSRCEAWCGKGRRRNSQGCGTHTTMLGKGMEGSQGACVRRDSVQNQVVRIIGRRGPSASSGQSLDSRPALAGMTFLRGDAGWKAGNPLYSGRYRVRGWDECEVMGPAAKVPSQ